MHARVVTFQGAPGQSDQIARAVSEVIYPASRQIGGFVEAYWLLNEETGRALSISLWATEEDLRASREAVLPLRAKATEASSATVLSVDEFTVIAKTSGT